MGPASNPVEHELLLVESIHGKTAATPENAFFYFNYNV